MKLIRLTTVLLVAWTNALLPAYSSPVRVRIAEATFVPQYGPGGSKKAVRIGAFEIDRTPVTRAGYARFLRKNPAWAKGKAQRSFAEEGYLSGWVGNRPPPGTALHPVVHVSYFAAAAYCEWAGGRLPTLMEWEYVAAAGRKTPEGAKDPAQVAEWMKAYSTPDGPREVGRSEPNFHGVHDLHGMVWEWTQDYNSTFVSADNREDGEMSSNLFCGTGAMSAADRANYPAFMRYAMRGGLRPNYTIANQGFRCAYD